jgi:hypothetical protein
LPISVTIAFLTSLCIVVFVAQALCYVATLSTGDCCFFFVRIFIAEVVIDAPIAKTLDPALL